jgi:GT2 family glycosyltransferase
LRPHIAAVVLNFRTPSDTVLAVKSLLASRRPLDRIVVVDNDTRENVREPLAGLRRPVSTVSNVTYLLTGANLGFSGGINVGIRDALAQGADRILLVNSDVIVPPDCVERLERALDEPGVGIVGPTIVSRSDPGWIASLGMSYSTRTGRMRHAGIGQRLAAGEAAASGAVDGVSGCLMLIRREVFDAIGLFHEEYFFSFEDLDFCLTAARAGFRTFRAGDAIGYHEGGRSIGADAVVRLYFGTRNHLMLAHRIGPHGRWYQTMSRTGIIVLLNLAHAVRARGGSVGGRIGAVMSGVRDYFLKRTGPPRM